MKFSDFCTFAGYGIRTVLFGLDHPILGTIIVTDRCNLHCLHCSVNNITFRMASWREIRREMRDLYALGVRILFLCGGETFLWRDGDRTLRDLVIEAKRQGFLIVNVVTNGTFPLELPEADLILLSLDGDRKRHNAIRGDTYDAILENIRKTPAKNICLYMAINRINKDAIRHVAGLAKKLPAVRAVSFNFHTPYPDTRDLALTKEEKAACLDVIRGLMKKGYPVFNLKSAFPALLSGNFPKPCRECVVVENGKLSVCGRCGEIPGLCEECGYFFAAEYSLLFAGHPGVMLEMLLTYPRYV